MHTCIHAYMHTCIHAYMHTCIHAYMHTYIHTGMKEVPVSEFIEDKTYLFYSHTIKAQKDNMPMLDAILKKVNRRANPPLVV